MAHSTPASAPVSLFDSADFSRAAAQAVVSDTLKGAEDGELFVEKRQSESLVWDDGKLKSASFDEQQGFGLRAVRGETAAYAHATDLSLSALKRAAEVCRTVASGSAVHALAPEHSNVRLYADTNPSEAMGFEAKIALLQKVDAFTRGLDPRIKQVSVSMAADWQAVEILRGDGQSYRDIRPLVRFNVSVVSSNGKEQGQGSHGLGGRGEPLSYFTGDIWMDAAREALRQSLVSLDARPAPAGEMDVLLGPGWPGILLHEAVGHGLEGDFHRKKTSVFSGMLGQRIAAEGVTIVDDGTIPNRRGSISIDDEGTPSHATTLIDNGILVGLMQDRMNARLLGMAPTGNGRRQSYAHAPMPRMTNTYMLAGGRHPDEIRASIKRGLYAKSFGGGQVDITSGKFVFSCTEAYLIEDGRITTPVKGATLIGAGADALTRISMVGNDMALDPGVGTCGKQGQGVPVGVGQPSLRIDGLTWAAPPPDAMRPEAVIFDMDDVLCRYDLGKRLRVLSLITGRTPRDIRAAIWDSGFEDVADSGGYSDPEHYLREFGRRIGHPLSRADWVRARREAMQPWPEMLDLARAIGTQARTAVYTNNGPLTKAAIAELFPDLAGAIGEHYYSFEFATKKPDPDSYRRLMACMKMSPEACLFIDDKRSNVMGARMAGLYGHHFRNRERLVAELRELGFAA